MDPKHLGTSTIKDPPKKLRRFAPKPPPNRDEKPILPKVEKTEVDIDGAQAEQLLRRLNETSLGAKPKFQKKVEPAQVAFGIGGSSSSIRSYGAPKKMIGDHGTFSGDGGEQRVEKEYKEPWDYYSNYPVTLPLRRPHSGNPELLNEEEFGQDPEGSAYDETAMNPAEELGLLDENAKNELIFLQLPSILPQLNQSSEASVERPCSSAKGTNAEEKSHKSSFEKLPPGLIGKLLVYRNGDIKMKIGDALYNVSPGVQCSFAQDAALIQTQERNFYNLGELNKRAVVTPDIDSLLASISDLNIKVLPQQ